MTVPAFRCPITGEVFEDPVVTSDGHSYESTSISQWFLRRQTSPLTNMRLTRTTKRTMSKETGGVANIASQTC